MFKSCNIISYSFIFLFFIIFNITVYIHANQFVYWILGVLVILFYTYSVAHRPAFIITVFLTSFAPLFYSLQYWKISSIIIIFVLFLSGVALLSRPFSLKLKRATIGYPLIFITISFFPHLFTFEIYSSIAAYSRLLVFMVIPILLINSELRYSNKIESILKFAFFFNTLLLLSFLVLYYIKPWGYFHWKIESAIGISFVAYINLMLLYMVKIKFKWLLSILFLFLLLIILQRAFLFALLVFLLIYFRKDIKKYFVFVPIFILIIIGGLKFIELFIASEKLYKIQFLEKFVDILSNWRAVINLPPSVLNEKFGSIGLRIHFWIEGLFYFFSNNWLLGNGIKTFYQLSGGFYPHNIIVDYLFSFGFIGFLFFVLYLIFIYRNINRISRKISGSKRDFLLAFNFSLYAILMFSSGFERTMFYTIVFINLFSVLYLDILYKSTLSGVK